MISDDLLKNLKIIVVLALIIGILGAVGYLIYGFLFLWQAMAAFLFSIFLSVIAIAFLFLSIYLWIKNLLLKRELNRSDQELKRVSNKLKKCYTELKNYKTNKDDEL